MLNKSATFVDLILLYLLKKICNWYNIEANKERR